MVDEALHVRALGRERELGVLSMGDVLRCAAHADDLPMLEHAAGVDANPLRVPLPARER